MQHNSLLQFGWLENKKTRTADTGKISWWFVIHADEAVLCELDSKWESVNLQISWQLQSCSKPAVVNDVETHAGGATSLLDENPSGNTDINEITIDSKCYLHHLTHSRQPYCA